MKWQSLHDATQTSNDAFQLALCCQSGFGTPRNVERAAKLVLASRKTAEELDLQIQYIKEVRNLSTHKNQTYQRVHTSQGLELDFGTYYGHGLQTLEAEAEYRREVADTSSAFGESHTIPTLLKQRLVEILKAQGRWHDAKDIQICRCAVSGGTHNARQHLSSGGIVPLAGF